MLRDFAAWIVRIGRASERILKEWIRPTAALFCGVAQDLIRSKRDLVLENALLRQQLIVVRRQIKRPKLTPGDRVRMIGLASITKGWRDALLLVQPDTLLRWHRHGFRLLWRHKTRRRRAPGPRLAREIVSLIQQMARDNVLWGAERIRGELLKLGIRVSKRTIQKYSYAARGPRPRGQSWTAFLQTHTHPIWACDFVQTYDVFFRAVFAFFIIDLGSRKVVHVGVTRSPTASWVAQQLRNVTSFDDAAPRFLIRDNDSKFGTEFDRVADGAGVTILRTPYHAPKANAVCERFLGSARRECLDHTLTMGVGHLERVLAEYVTYFNGARPHQGVRQSVPSPSTIVGITGTKILAFPVLGGLHHDYRWAA